MSETAKLIDAIFGEVAPSAVRISLSELRLKQINEGKRVLFKVGKQTFIVEKEK